MSHMQRLKNVDDRTKNIVFGYSRLSQTECNLNVPTMIQYLFMVYYWINEYFTDHGECITLDKNNIIATASDSNHYTFNTVYGNNVICIDDKSVKKYKWKVRMNKISLRSRTIYFGIDSSDNKFIDGSFINTKLTNRRYFAIGSDGYCHTWFKATKARSLYIEQTDTIEIILEIKDKDGNFRLSYNLCDGLAKGVIANDVKFDGNKFNFAVSIELPPNDFKTQQIELISFETA